MQSLFLCSTFLFVLITYFFSFCFDCVLFSKIVSFGLVLSFDFFVFYLILVRLESGLKRIIHLALIWF